MEDIWSTTDTDKVRAEIVLALNLPVWWTISSTTDKVGA